MVKLCYMIEIRDTDVNIVINCIPMRNCMPASAYGLKAISDWFFMKARAFQAQFGRDDDNMSISFGRPIFSHAIFYDRSHLMLFYLHFKVRIEPQK